MQGMIKALSPEVAKDVGKSAAIMLQQLIQWFKLKTVSKVYRTNDELFEDLNGILSVATIQRCKQRLIDKGYISVSFDKGLNRTTHYSLTEKGSALLTSYKTQRKANTDVLNDSATSVPVDVKTTESAQPVRKQKVTKAVCNSSNPAEHSSAMKEAFSEGFTNKKAVPVPEHLKNLFKPKSKVEPKPVDANWEEIVKAELELLEDDSQPEENLSPVDLAVLDAINAQNELKTSQFGSLVKSVYQRAATTAQESLYAMKESQYNFCEDY